MGEAEARDLGLDGGSLYDPLVNYNRVRRRVSDYGTGPDPQPVATRTADTPAQGSEVTKPLDPALEAPVDTDPHLTTGARAKGR
jgi:outer membrane protein